MDPAVRKHDERLFPAPVQVLGNEYVRVEPERIPCPLSCRIRLIAQGWAGQPRDVDLCVIAQAHEEHHVVDLARQLVDLLTQRCVLAVELLADLRECGVLLRS